MKVSTIASARPIVVAITMSMAFATVSLADDIGFEELLARVGAGNLPTGTSVRLAQVEAFSGTAYGPDQADAQFVGKTFVAMSGTPGNSGHATFVARNYYGIASSVTPGVSQIHLYQADNFVQSGYLRLGSGSAVPPLVAPTGVRVFNNSWIGSTGQVVYDNETLRRADFAMNRDGTLFCNGENNGSGSVMQPLMSEGYHGLGVGRMDGQHSAGLTPAIRDGGGRTKPEIVAPGSGASYSTAVVASCAALLYDVAQVDPILSTNLDARRPAVVKACLMAGARHRDGWTNNPATSGATRGQTASPLDSLYGADLVNIDEAHWILTGGEVTGTSTVPGVDTTTSAAWAYPPVSNTSSYFRFSVGEIAPEVSILATWHRSVPTTFGTPTMPNYDLYLHSVSGTTLGSLVGNGGVGVFGSGNVASVSAVDNVEHLFLKGLQPGEYVIEVRRMSASTSPSLAVAWNIPDYLPPAVPGDTNGDGRVDGTDLATVLSSWGLNIPAADFDGNGVVDGADLSTLLGNWG